MAAAEPPARPVPTMITESLRRLAGLTSLALKRRSSQRFSIGPVGRLGVGDVRRHRRRPSPRQGVEVDRVGGGLRHQRDHSQQDAYGGSRKADGDHERHHVREQVQPTPGRGAGVGAQRGQRAPGAVPQVNPTASRAIV